MGNTVHDGFSALLVRTEPTEPEDTARLTHRATIKQGLSTAFDVNRVEVIGSHTRGSAIHVWSDVDYLAVLSRDDVIRNGRPVASSTTLSNVRNALRDRFPRTEIAIDGCAVVVSFGQGKGRVDVVPAYYQGTFKEGDGYPVFGIPDGDGGWRSTSPQRHGKYLGEADRESGFKLSKTVRLVKTWRYARRTAIPCLGFHCELLLASERLCVGARGYSSILMDVFSRLARRNGRSIQDPLGISGIVPATRTDVQRGLLVDAARSAAECATRAVQFEKAGRHEAAYRQWNMVFNGQFPAR